MWLGSLPWGRIFLRNFSHWVRSPLEYRNIWKLSRLSIFFLAVWDVGEADCTWHRIWLILLSKTIQKVIFMFRGQHGVKYIAKGDDKYPAWEINQPLSRLDLITNSYKTLSKDFFGRVFTILQFHPKFITIK